MRLSLHFQALSLCRCLLLALATRVRGAKLVKYQNHFQVAAPLALACCLLLRGRLLSPLSLLFLDFLHHFENKCAHSLQSGIKTICNTYSYAQIIVLFSKCAFFMIIIIFKRKI
jgi:hypothetical protein